MLFNLMGILQSKLFPEETFVVNRHSEIEKNIIRERLAIENAKTNIEQLQKIKETTLNTSELKIVIKNSPESERSKGHPLVHEASIPAIRRIHEQTIKNSMLNNIIRYYPELYHCISFEVINQICEIMKNKSDKMNTPQKTMRWYERLDIYIKYDSDFNIFEIMYINCWPDGIFPHP